MTSVVAAIAGSAAIARPAASPSMPGIIMSRIATRNGLPLRGRLAQPAQRPLGIERVRRGGSRQSVEHAGQHPAVRRVVVHDEHAHRRRCPTRRRIGCSVVTLLAAAWR